MNAKTKRRLTARVLLAVFLPMLLFSSLHIHPSQVFGNDECAECVHHHCGGHLGQLTWSQHDCVLCQFLTLTMVLSCAVTVFIYNNVSKHPQSGGQSSVTAPVQGCVVTRGPPSAG